MEVLVYGAGVIGSLLAHTLCNAGHQVTLAARNARKESLEKNGLVIHHTVQKKTTVDHPKIVSSENIEGKYDVLFCVMQFQQTQSVLKDLARIDSPYVILCGNNLQAEKMEQKILDASENPKTVLFAFQTSGGSRKGDGVECVYWKNGSMTLGKAHSALSQKEKDFFTALFAGSGYSLQFESDMDGWLKCHLALILPIAYLCYQTGCDLKKADHAKRKLLLDAANEGFALLKKLQVEIRPAGEDAYYQPGAKRLLCAAMLFAMEKSFLGKLCASDHCRHAVGEMEALDLAWENLRMQAGAAKMPCWQKLKEEMPAWKELHALYDAKPEVERKKENV
jgi:2-dehydropantoate 2-reductase